MYEIKFESAKRKKDFKKIIKKVSENKKKRVKNDIENSPYPSKTHGDVLNKIEKKRDCYCYPLTGGDRILFLIYESPKKYVEIIFAGTDDEEIRFLKKRSE